MNILPIGTKVYINNDIFIRGEIEGYTTIKYTITEFKYIVCDPSNIKEI